MNKNLHKNVIKCTGQNNLVRFLVTKICTRTTYMEQRTKENQNARLNLIRGDCAPGVPRISGILILTIRVCIFMSVFILNFVLFFSPVKRKKKSLKKIKNVAYLKNICYGKSSSLTISGKFANFLRNNSIFVQINK